MKRLGILTGGVVIQKIIENSPDLIRLGGIAAKVA